MTIKNLFNQLTSYLCPPTEHVYSSLYDSLCDVQTALDQQRNFQEVRQDGIEQLAEKLNGIVDEVIKVESSSSFDQDDLHKLYEFSGSLLTIDPVNAALWERLAKPVQEFICSLHPLFQPPTDKIDLAMRIPRTSRLGKGETKTLMFGDRHIFRATFLKTSFSRLSFSIAKQKDLKLKATASLDSRIQEKVQEYTAHLPYGINIFFHIDKLLKTIRQFGNQPNLKVQIVSQLTHQLFIAKQTYLNMMLHAVGMPAKYPLEYALQGEWIIEPRETSESPQKIADQIAQFLILEKTLGIYLLGDSESVLDPEQTALFEVKENLLYCSIPRKRIEFLRMPFEQRLKKVNDFLAQSHPDFARCIPQIEEAVGKVPSPNKIIEMIREGFASGRLERDHPLNTAIVSVCLQLPEAFFSPPIEWDQFQSPKDFFLYCKLQLETSGKSLEIPEQQTFLQEHLILISAWPEDNPEEKQLRLEKLLFENLAQFQKRRIASIIKNALKN
ncbi:hypothetical protein [Waddlia chondrophila]|uniref:Uncharacterized protein n=1 Tax=Waddlia chondrophila (strain ATCC VR-1470 / WSU 86-1044) TaxID=716544 RepID=D6YRU5_WADCW|nr:hypothetical protein [Waddlia chondrophila]ADI38790.1 hypothetical protein wcw_1441 [Waddlia chondrophila WSU 86-1044]